MTSQPLRVSLDVQPRNVLFREARGGDIEEVTFHSRFQKAQQERPFISRSRRSRSENEFADKRLRSKPTGTCVAGQLQLDHAFWERHNMPVPNFGSALRRRFRSYPGRECVYAHSQYDMNFAGHGRVIHVVQHSGLVHCRDFLVFAVVIGLGLRVYRPATRTAWCANKLYTLRGPSDQNMHLGPRRSDGTPVGAVLRSSTVDELMVRSV